MKEIKKEATSETRKQVSCETKNQILGKNGENWKERRL